MKKPISNANALMFDEDGKALYGTPGAGAYDTVGSFGENVVFNTAPGYSFGVKTEGEYAQPFLSEEHAKSLAMAHSPGPGYAYHDRSYKTVAPTHSFGTADRGAERGRYISQTHCRENLAATTPGPGTYRLKQGKGISRTLGDAPAYAFSTAPQRDFIGEKEMLTHPGPGAHHPPNMVGDRDEHKNPTTEWTPKYSFAPHGSMDRGSLRQRDQDSAVFVSEAHSQSGCGLAKQSPGPGEYERRSGLGDVNGRHLIDSNQRNKYEPSHSFPKAKRATDAAKKPYISKQHVDPNIEAPGPKYDLPEKLLEGAPALKFGSGRRFHSPEQGGNKAGPVIAMSRAFAEQTIGANSPGPAKYQLKEGKGIAKTIGDAPSWRFSTADRMGPSGKGAQETDVPGPGAYQLPKNTPELSGGGGMYSAAPTHSVASCLRSSLVTKDPEEPGPGAFETDVGIANKDIRKRGGPEWKFGKDKNRHSFMKDNQTPGPGSYQPTTAKDVGRASAFSFGGTHQKSGSGTGSIHISKEHAKEYIGKNSPGPGAYNLAEGKGIAKTIGDAATIKFGTETRENTSKVFMGAEHVKIEAGIKNKVPGPGSYNPNGLAGIGNRYKNTPGTSFGTSTRPPLASVKF